MSKTEVVHWRFDCRVYVFVDCSFPLLILSALYLYCYHWSFALPFTVHLIFGQVGAKPTHFRSDTLESFIGLGLLVIKEPQLPDSFCFFDFYSSYTLCYCRRCTTVGDGYYCFSVLSPLTISSPSSLTTLRSKINILFPYLYIYIIYYFCGFGKEFLQYIFKDFQERNCIRDSGTLHAYTQFQVEPLTLQGGPGQVLKSIPFLIDHYYCRLLFDFGICWNVFNESVDINR